MLRVFVKDSFASTTDVDVCERMREYLRADACECVCVCVKCLVTTLSPSPEIRC